MVKLPPCDSIKKTYNLTLERHKNAEKWIDNKNRTKEEINKYLQQFKDISMKLNDLLNKIGSYAHEEAINGFN